MMFFDPECIPCVVKQAFNSANLFTNGNKEVQLKIMKEVCADLQEINEYFSAPMYSRKIDSIIQKYYPSEDLYKKIKEENVIKVLEHIPSLKRMMDNSTDKLETAFRISIAGNSIDIGVNPDFDIEDEINRIAAYNALLSSDYKFKTELENANLILFIGDNYEEALFDKFLLTELASKKVVFAVRSKAILNDITLDDAKRLGIDKICDVIESGSTIAGTDLTQCTPEFLDIYHKADIVIAKGQGNYETLFNETRQICFLFKVKCNVIANRSGFPVGNGVMLFNHNTFKESYEKL